MWPRHDRGPPEGFFWRHQVGDLAHAVSGPPQLYQTLILAGLWLLEGLPAGHWAAEADLHSYAQLRMVRDEAEGVPVCTGWLEHC